MIDDLLEAHILTQASAAWPLLEANSFILKFTSGEFIYIAGNTKIIGEERITATLIVDTDQRLDREPFIQRFPTRVVTLTGGDGETAMVHQEYKSYRLLHQHVEAIGNDIAVFTLIFTHKYRRKAEVQ